MGLFDFIGGPRQKQPQKDPSHRSTIEPSAQVPYLKGEKIAGEYLVEDVFGGAGASGMGVVYLVSHRDYALPFVLKTFQAGSANSDLKQRFLREAELWIKIGIHPNVVQALWAREIDTNIYVAAEFVPKDSLGRNTITDFLPFCPRMLPNVLRWCAEFCYAMKHAQARGIIAHRDIKPDNLMVDPRGRLKVTDFGLVRGTMENSLKDVSFSESSPNPDLTMAGSILGTLPFMAPEQFQDSASVDHRADIYAFGIVLHQMLTGGDYPYQMSRKPTNILQEYFQAHTHGELRSLDSPLFTIIKKSLQKTPNKRYGSYDSMLSDIFRAAKQLGITLPPPTVSVEESVEELYRQAVTLSQLGKHKEALEKIDRYIRQRPDDYNGWAEKGEILARFDQHEGAPQIAMQKDLKGVSPESKEQIDFSRTYEGMECTRKALALYSEDSHCWSNLGVYHSRLWQWKESVDAFRKALELDPQNNGAHMQLASAYMFQDEFSRAADHLLTALRLAPNKKTLLFNAGNHAAFMLSKGAVEEAGKVLEVLVNLEPMNTNSWNNLAGIYERTGKKNDALRCLQKVVEINPLDNEVFLALANMHAAAGRMEDAIHCCDMVLGNEINESTAKAICFKAQLLCYSGRHSEGFSLLKGAIHKWPEDDRLIFLLGNLYEGIGDLDNAEKSILLCKQILDGRHLGPQSDNRQMVDAMIERLRRKRASQS